MAWLGVKNKKRVLGYQMPLNFVRALFEVNSLTLQSFKAFDSLKPFFLFLVLSILFLYNMII